MKVEKSHRWVLSLYIVERIGRGHGPLTDQPVDADFSLLLSPEDRVAQDLEDQPGALGAREEALLVFTPEELVQLVQSEGGRVVVGREVGDVLVHHVGQTEGGEEAGGPVPAGGWPHLGETQEHRLTSTDWGRLAFLTDLDWCSEVELHCHVADDGPGGVELHKVETLLALVLIFLQ